ncbi:uncharacterized protein LOC131434999 isoform X1 [Malaya genurostris]|uniref:uncharacterized protein LOC131434999 isoform X1 n=1 Tax=Malaya genurostris TaxID=325434 RepID=UPI0026F3D498|nr:uncharacterized protein LOC131434999 isoform X1 [Malaya genurostris]
MNSEKRKLDLYLLLCQSAYALIVALLRAAQNGSPYIQAAIKQKMFQLAETLRLYLREQSFLPEPRTTPMTPGRTLGASRSIRDMSAAFNRSRFGQGAHSSAQFPSPAAAIRPQMKSLFEPSVSTHRPHRMQFNQQRIETPQTLGRLHFTLQPPSGHGGESFFSHPSQAPQSSHFHSSIVDPPSPYNPEESLIRLEGKIPKTSDDTPQSSGRWRQPSSQRFPVLHRLLEVLSETDDKTLYSQHTVPVLDDPSYRDHLMQEIDEVIGLTADNMSGWGNETLNERLGRIEVNVETMLEQFNRLEKRTDPVLSKEQQPVEESDKIGTNSPSSKIDE